MQASFGGRLSLALVVEQVLLLIDGLKNICVKIKLNETVECWRAIAQIVRTRTPLLVATIIATQTYVQWSTTELHSEDRKAELAMESEGAGKQHSSRRLPLLKLTVNRQPV